MYTLANADIKTSISVLKSDIFQVHLRLEKVKNLNKRPQSRRRSEISAIQKGTAEVEEIVKSIPENTDDELRFLLARLLNEKMVELEETVFKLGGGTTHQEFRPSMSRLPIWLKMMDKYMEFTCPEICSRPSSRADSRTQKASVAGSGSRTREDLSTGLQAELHEPLTKLMDKYGLKGDGLPGSSDYITSAVNTLGGIIQAQNGELEKLKTELDRVISNSGASGETADLNPGKTEDKTSIEKLKVANQEAKHLRERIKDLTGCMKKEREKMTKDMSHLRKTLQASRKVEEGCQKETVQLKTDLTKALNKISELEDTIKLEGLKSKNTSDSTNDQTTIKVTENSKYERPNYSWVLTQMMKSHEEALDLMRGKNRKLVEEVMQLQDTNLELMRRLTTRDTKVKAIKKKDASFHEIMKTEMDAMKSAFESRIAILQRELGQSRHECRKVTAQLSEHHQSQQSALSARGKLFNFQLISEQQLAASTMNEK